MAQYAPVYDQEPQPTCYDPSKSASRVSLHHESQPTMETDVQSHFNGSHNDNSIGTREYYRIQEWGWELLSWAAGTAIMAGIVAILFKFNNIPVKDWPSSIQINTVVAFLSQVAQAALLVPTEACISQLKWAWFKTNRKTIHLQWFDEASRGPLGSLCLIFSLGFIPRLVHLGALITVFMLVFSTFFQQSVQTHLRPLEYTAEPATIPRMKAYDRQPTPESYSEGLYRTTSGSNINLANAIFSSLLTSGANLSDVQGICPAGHCIWDTYTTLGICHSSQDVTSQLVQEPPSFFLGSPVILPGLKYNYNDTRLTAWVTTVYGMGKGIIDAKGFNTPESLKDPRWQLSNPDSNLDDLAHIYMGYQDPCLMKTFDDSSLDSWKAFKGSVRLCLLTLNTTHNTSTDTTIVRSHTNLHWSDSWDTKHPNSTSYAWTTRLPESSEDFTIDMSTTELIAGQLATSLDMSASFLPGGDNYLYGSLFASGLISEIIGPDPLVCPNSTDNGFKGFEKRMANIATSLTNTFRTINGSVLVDGKSFQAVQFIRVKFLFLIPPGVLFVLVTVFFFCTVIHTTHTPVWKSSQLAALYVLHEPENLDSKSSMEKKAKSIKMKFTNRDTWQMSHN